MNKKIAIRDAFGEALVELGEKNEKVVVLDADVSNSTRTIKFEERFPDRFFNVGVAEANMMNIATTVEETAMGTPNMPLAVMKRSPMTRCRSWGTVVSGAGKRCPNKPYTMNKVARTGRNQPMALLVPSNNSSVHIPPTTRSVGEAIPDRRHRSSYTTNPYIAMPAETATRV